MMISAGFFGKENSMHTLKLYSLKIFYCNPTDHHVTCDFYYMVRMYCPRDLKCVQTVQTHFSTRKMEQNVVNLGHFYELSCVTKSVAQFDATQQS